MLAKKLIALLLSVVILLSMAACGEKPSGNAADAVQRKAVISQLSGEVRILRGDGSAEKAAQGSVLLSGDSVLTEQGAVASLSLDDDKTLTVSPSSEIMFSTLSEEGGTKTVILVKRGSLANSVDQKLEAGDIYEVCTGDMTMAIRGTDAYLEATKNGTIVSLLTGYALSFNYQTGKVYVVPAGVSALFPPNAEPSFELIDPETFASCSEAAAAMLKKVEKENRNYKKDFETELREDYIDNSGYSFSISEPLAGAVPAEEITTTQAVTTTASTTTATTAATTTSQTKPAAPTAKPTAKPTAPTAAPTLPTLPTPPIPPLTIPTDITTTTTATTTTVTTTVSTTASTTPTTPTTPTAPTAPTEPTEQPPQPPAPPVAPTSVDEPDSPVPSAATTASSTTTVTTTTTATTTATESTAAYYDVTLTGLYCREQGGSEWIPLTTAKIWGGRMQLNSFESFTYTLNGEQFSFWVQCSEQMASPYDYPYYASSHPSQYQSVMSYADAVLVS